MPLEPTETPLPGLGVPYGFATAHGGRLAIIDRDDGVAELYCYAGADQDEPSGSGGRSARPRSGGGPA